MRNVFIGISALLALGAAGGATWWLQADQARLVSPGAATSSSLLLQPATPPPIAAPTATPNIITVGTSTQLLFTVSIPDPNVTGVNLLRVNANGNSTIAAAMLDNGQNGDQQPGDKVFTARLTLNEAQAGEVKFQVSAAFRGTLRRSVSPSVIVTVWAKVSDPQSGLILLLPPFSVPYRYFFIERAGSSRSLDVQLFDGRRGEYVSTFAITLYPNPNVLSLSAWFQDTIDPGGTLLNTGVYKEILLSAHVSSLSRSAPLPDAFINANGPVEDIFATLSGSTIVIGFIQSQDVRLVEFGYSESAIKALFESIARTVSQ